MTWSKCIRGRWLSWERVSQIRERGSCEKLISFAVDDVATTPPPALCNTFNPFPGYWDNLHFLPTPSASPCSLLTPSLPPSFLSSSPSANITWISILGDSVHFQPEVYDEWARIVWTEMMREKEVQAED